MPKKIKIYYSGNELFSEDNMPFEVVPILRSKMPQINFVHHDPNENIPTEEKNICIIDTVINTKKVIEIRDLEKLATDDIYSPHDWDLAFNLKLLQKINRLDEILIIGIPPQGDVKSIADEVEKIIYNQFIRKK